jgi:hypothetical protein
MRSPTTSGSTTTDFTTWATARLSRKEIRLYTKSHE